ncbi:hypothetical protein [Ammoniphilus sp. 3BR4]|uniref:hypothetical protein n=1 Tax=Ammoniphilus sp. 3BR4 TaxID=3158265 RepID=UPI0034672581
MKRISLVLSFSALIIFLISTPVALAVTLTTASNKTNQPFQINHSENHIRIVKNAVEAGKGTLTNENIDIAGVHIGDSQEKVKKLLGEPTKRIREHSTPSPMWYYENLNMYVSFYAQGEPSNHIGGAVRISVNHPSSVKTNKGFGVGDNLDTIVRAFPQINITEPTEEGIQNVWINGTSEVGDMYYPSLQVILKQGTITNMRLESDVRDVN